MTARGPWRVTDPAGGPRVRDAAGTVIARVYLRDGYMQVAEMIAAAPEMLAALEAVSVVGCLHQDDPACAVTSGMRYVRDAIDKARGRVPAEAD